MHDHGTRCTEPGVQMRHTRDLIAFDIDIVGACLHQMLDHVALEVGQQLHLLVERLAVICGGHVRLLAVLVDEVHVDLVGQQNQLRSVVEHHANALIAELVTKAVFVAVVHPLGYPEERLCCRIGVLVAQIALQNTRLNWDNIKA